MEMSSGQETQSWWPTIRFYGLVFIGFVALLVSVPICLERPIWLLLFAPGLFVWSIWLLHAYWVWVRKLGQ